MSNPALTTYTARCDDCGQDQTHYDFACTACGGTSALTRAQRRAAARRAKVAAERRRYTSREDA